MNIVFVDENYKIQDSNLTEIYTFYNWKEQRITNKNKAFLSYVIEDNKIELRQIFVQKEEREKGHGRLLLNKLENISKLSGKMIYVKSSTTEEEIFGKFLKKNGFVKIDEKTWGKLE